MEPSFKSIFYKQETLLKEFCLSESQLYKLIADWQTKGNDTSLMGLLPKFYARSRVWDPRVFYKWLDTNILKRPVQYDYERAVVDKIKKAPVVILNQQQQRKVI